MRPNKNMTASYDCQMDRGNLSYSGNLNTMDSSVMNEEIFEMVNSSWEISKQNKF